MKFSAISTDYKYPTVVRHQGMSIVLALRKEDEVCNIYYRVLATDPVQPDDDKSWSDRKKLSFPDQIRPAGMSLVTVGLKTAERTADAPFQALSDGKHVYLFRQSTDGALYVDRFVFDPAPKTLNPTWEARFQRNRKRDLPASRKDTLGARDMEGEPFFEPTTELTVVKGLQDGRFCALLLPGRLPSQWRWQVLATNLEGEIDSFSIRRGEDGLFDMDDVRRTCLKWADVGRRFQTGPAALLYMRQEEAQDEYGRPQRVKRGARVMLAAPVGSARYALELDGVNDYVEIPSNSGLDLGANFTIEAWIKPAVGYGVPRDGYISIVSRRGPDDSSPAYLLGLNGQGNLLFWTYDGSNVSQLTSKAIVPVDKWSHIAGVLEKGTLKVYINGLLDDNVPNAVTPQPSVEPVRIGADPVSGNYFKGQLNQVRLWNLSRDQADIQQDMHDPLEGDEPRPVGYWPFDEGSGDTVYDRVSENHGQLHVGYFLELDGVDDYVYMEDFEWPAGGPVTVEFWAKVNAADVRNSSAFTVGAQNNPNRFHVHLPYGDKYLCWDYGHSDGAGRVKVDYGPYLDQWTHVALVSEGKEGQLMGIYLNGRLVASNPSSDGPDEPLKELWIGKWYLEGIHNHKGQIADFRIWKRVRSADDIQANMRRRLNGDEEDLVGYWPLDEGSGDTIRDQASGHHGQLEVGFGYALDFDGVDDYVSIPPINLNAYNTMSIEAWVKPVDITTNTFYEIVRQEGANWRPDWLLAFQDHGQILSFGLFAGGSYQELDVPIRPTDYTDGKWHHIAATYDGQAQRLYRDGSEIGSKSKTDHIRFSANAVHSIGSHSGKWEFFKGQIGQVCLWNVARTPEDIQQDKSNYLTGDESGLAACWSLDEGTGDRIQDLASENHGQFYIGSGDNLERKWVKRSPLPDDVSTKWGVGPDNPNDKWVAVPPIAILDFGVSREGTLALIRDMEGLPVTLALSGGDSTATLSIPAVEADANGAAVPMPTIAVDKKGLTVSAGLLNFDLSRTGDTPFLLDGADGLIHLYFRGDYGQFLVAQHDTLTARAKYIALLNDGDGGPKLLFTARRPGTQMQGYTISIDGSDAQTCQVAMHNKHNKEEGIQETWPNVPRTLESFLAVLNGTATNDDNDPLVKEGKLVSYDYGNVVRKGVPDDLAPRDEPFGSTLFAVGADNLPDTGVTITVRNAAAEMATPGRDCAWIPEPQGKALRFLGAEDYVALPHDKLAIAGDLAVEAWVKVEDEAGSSGRLRLVNYHSEGPRFTLGLVKDEASNRYKAFAASEDKAVQTADAQVSPKEEWTHLAAVYNATTALKLDGQGYVDCGNDVTLDMTEAVTVEAWVTPEREGSERLQPEVILSKWGAAEEEQSWRLYIDTDDKPCFETRDQDRKLIRVKGNVPLAANRPYHLAGVFEGAPEKVWALKLDGEAYVEIEKGPDLKDVSFSVAFWAKPDRTGDAFHVVLGQGEETHNGYQCLHIGFRENHQFTFGFWHDDLDAAANYTDTEWHHWACTYDAGTKERTIYRDGVPVAHDTSGQPYQGSGKLTIGSLRKTKWPFSGLINNVRIWDRALSIKEIGEDMDRPTLEVEKAVGNWAFDRDDSYTKTVEDHSAKGNDGVLHGGTFVSGDDDAAADKGSYAQKIWVDGDLQGWRRVTVDGETGPGLLANLTPSDTTMRVIQPPVQSFQIKIGDCLLLQDEQVVVKRVTPVQTGFDLVVDRAVNGIAREHMRNTEVYFLRREANEVASTTARVNIGRSASDEGYFQGTIDDVRLWDVGRRDWQIRYYRDQPLPGDAEGLVSDWRFEEGRGKTAIDSKGSNHGRLVHPESDEIEHMWTPAARNARLTLYVNGRPVQMSDEELGPDDFGGYGTTDQFTIGAMIAMIGEDKTPQQHMTGCIDEVRVWNAVRSGEQIGDNMYRALSGAEEGLAGYWPLDEGEGNTVRDQTGNGQDGILQGPQWIDSTAPIGNEGPEVLNAYRGLKKPGFNKKIAGPPSAVEYSDMQWDDEGNLFGVMKRCYIFKDDALQLVTGFKVGDLELNFVGQVQTAPTLIGYIEGAPPVPSENLTKDPGTGDYVGTSTIELTEAKETIQVYSASRDTGFDMSVELKAGVHWDTEISVGLGVQKKALKTEGKAGVHTYFEHSLGWLSEASKTAGTSKTLTKSLTLGGGWEEAQDYDQKGQLRYLNPEVGRRYLPNNMGYALVKSGTGDLFALRLKRTGSLVAFQVLPNPDIPEDWNIIMFPLNPKYVKNGTLDGMVGLVPDPDYPGAINGERGSYFKPLEAYALKEQIEREAKKIEGYYATFAAGAEGRKGGSGTGEGGLLAELPGGELGYDWETGRDRRSMVNTYVWTADGGFYAEEELFSSIRQESLGGSYHFLGQAGLFAEAQFATDVGFFFEVDALFGGHINVEVSKSEEERAAFGLHVDVQGEGFLDRWEGDPDKQEGSYTDELCPGKVDAYRFMTFYLAPKPQNFDQFFEGVESIVDPDWLNGQGKYAGEYGPNARALREARSKPNEVWRVLHRVTYVSRVPPQFKPTPEEAVPEDVRRPANVEANMGLIREIEIIKRRLPSIPGESHLMLLGRAVDRLLFGDASGNGQGQSKLEEIVSWWADRDEDVKKEIRQDLMTYLKAFYESDLTPPEIEEDKQRVTEGLQVLYTFEEGEGETVYDVSGVGALLDLTVADEAALSWTAGGLAINEPTLVATPGPATKLIEAAKASNEITIEAWVKPYNDTQQRARIVTLSGGISDRNFTLAQMAKNCYTRLRTSISDDPDADNRLTVQLTGDLEHLVYTRDASGMARFYLNGETVKTKKIKGNFSNWDDSHRLCLADEVGGERPWLGELRLVAIYNRALNPDEVSQNFEAGPD